MNYTNRRQSGSSSPRFLIWTSITVLLLLFCAVFLARYENEDITPRFPRKTQVVAYLPKPESERSLVLIRFKADGKTRISGTIYWKSGLIEDLTFEHNRVVSSVEYFPLDDRDEDPHTVRGIKRAEAKFAADGITYVYHAVYRKDGSLERLGQLLDSGGYQADFYFEDGKTLARERIFDSQKRYKQEKIYRRDGSLLASIYSKDGDYTKTETSLYRADGSLYADFTRDPIDGEKGHVYAADGHTMIVEYVRDYYSLQEIFLDAQGNLIQNRDGSRMGGLLTVRGYTPVKGKMLMEYRQRWTLTQTLGPDADKHRLLRVEYYDFARSRSCEIQMDVSGTIPQSVSCSEKDGGTLTKMLDADGTVKAIKKTSKNGLSRTWTPVGKPEKLQFPGKWFENYRPEPLPNWQDEDAPPPVYDFH